MVESRNGKPDRGNKIWVASRLCTVAASVRGNGRPTAGRRRRYRQKKEREKEKFIVLIVPFGFPVVPDVKMTYAASLG